MKTRINFYKLVSTVLIVGLMAPSVLLWPEQKVMAQPLDAGDFGDLGQGTEFQGENAGPDITSFSPESAGGDQVPAPNDSGSDKWQEKSCGKLIGGAVKGLFKSAKKEATRRSETETRGGLERAATEGTAAAESVPVFDVSVNQKLDAIDSKTSDIKTSTGYLFKKAGCLDSLAKFMMKTLIQKITLSIINWINYGRDGKPLFLSDPAGYFTNIAKEEIQSFGLAINDNTKFPFGKGFLTGVILGYKMKFEQQAEYSLDKLVDRTNPGRAGIDFNANFNVGGWDAWLGMTYPQNNPIGFNMMAANELSVRLDGTQQSKANYARESIRDATGFLGDERCAAPEGVTHKEHAEALNGVAGKRQCKKWVYVTPGKLIADLAIDSAKAPIKRLELADDINSALAAIADAAVNKFYAKLTDPNGKGLFGFSGAENTTTFDISFNGSGSSGTQFQEFYVTPGSWISNHLNFDLKTGLTQAVVDEQRTYQDKLALYTEALNELVKWIRQLDYCIPGPNPDWETTSEEILNSFGQGKLNVGRNKSFRETDVGKTWLFISDPGGYFKNLPFSADQQTTKDDEKAASAAAAIVAEAILKVQIDHTQKQMRNQGEVQTLFSNVFEGYRRKIQEVYFSGPTWPNSGKPKNFMPGVTIEAYAEFNRIAGYEQVTENNTKEIAFRKSIITRVEALKLKIDALNPNDPTYENNFTSTAPLVTEFARLSAYFVDGDDIANIDNLYEETKDKTKYVKDDLLTGPYGCETFMWKLWETDPLAYSTYARRQPYPFPIDHFYANVRYEPLVSLSQNLLPSVGKDGLSTTGPYNEPYTKSYFESYAGWLSWEGFLPFNFYYNNWGGPFGGEYDFAASCAESVKYQNDSSSARDICLSLPSSKEDPDADGSGGCGKTTSDETEDIPGLTVFESWGPGVNNSLRNGCGVVTRGLEKALYVY